MSDVENNNESSNVPVTSNDANAVEPGVTMEVESNDASTQVGDTVVDESENTVAESAPVPQVSLSINTLVQVKNLLDVAIARGMVKPNEMSTVGLVYDRFVGGLNTLLQQSQSVASKAD